MKILLPEKSGFQNQPLQQASRIHRIHHTKACRALRLHLNGFYTFPAFASLFLCRFPCDKNSPSPSFRAKGCSAVPPKFVPKHALCDTHCASCVIAYPTPFHGGASGGPTQAAPVRSAAQRRRSCLSRGKFPPSFPLYAGPGQAAPLHRYAYAVIAHYNTTRQAACQARFRNFANSAKRKQKSRKFCQNLAVFCKHGGTGLHFSII